MLLSLTVLRIELKIYLGHMFASRFLECDDSLYERVVGLHCGSFILNDLY